MIEMVIRVILAGIVSDPLAVGVDMGSLRMSGLVGGAPGRGRGVRRRLGGSRSTLGSVSTTHLLLAAAMFLAAPLLREHGENQRHRHCAQTDQ